jgi:RNA polymerase primary sigma factor
MSGRIPLLLKLAAISGVDSSVRLLLRRGVDVNATDNRGRSALMLAAEHGHAKTCRLLLDEGADYTLTDSEGLNALALAQPGRHTDVVLAILEHRARLVDQPTPIVNEPPLELSVADSEPGPAFDTSAWEEEEPQQVPPVDLEPVIASTAIQEAISNYRYVDDDADWADVEVRLPDSRRKPGRPDDLDGETLAAWRELIAEGIRRGSVPRSRIEEACVHNELSRDEAEYLLVAALDEYGVQVEEFEPWAWDCENEENDEGDEGDVAGDAIAFIVDLRDQRSSVFWSYFNSIPTSRITRDDESRLGQAMEQGQAVVLESLSNSPELLGLLEGIGQGLAEPPTAGAADARALAGDEALVEEDIGDGIALTGARLCEVVRRRRLERRSGYTGAVADGDVATLSASRAVVAKLTRVVQRQRLTSESARRLLAGFSQWHAAWSEMVASTLRLVVHLVRKSWRAGVPIDDLIQEGNIGLMRSVEKYDYRRGTPFGSYAAWWVRARVGRYVSQSSLIRLSSGSAEVRRKAMLARRKLDTAASDASLAEIARHIGLDEATVQRAVAVPHDVVPLPDPGDLDDYGVQLADLTAHSPEDDACASDLTTRLNTHLSGLAARQMRILQLRFGLVDGEEHTLSEIGKKLGLSRERIRQIERDALCHLRRQPSFADLVTAADSEEDATDDS